MSSNFEFDMINFEGRGYFGCPVSLADAEFPRDPNTEPWLAWVVALDRAKQGNFAYVAHMLDLYNQGDYVFQGLCCILLGDAGPDTCFPDIIKRIKTDWSAVAIVDFCKALIGRGKLADVPVLVDGYKRHVESKDMAIIPVWINDLIGSEATPIPQPQKFASLNGYIDYVKVRYRELVELFGTDQLLIFRGEKFSVVKLARCIHSALRKPYFRIMFRHKFEASTGIDCTGFYLDGELQPLSAAAIVEDFLDGPEAEKFEDGVRYFFGHRILD